MKPVIDHDIIVGFPKDLLISGDFPVVPYMTGTVRAEFGKNSDKPTHTHTHTDVHALMNTHTNVQTHKYFVCVCVHPCVLAYA